MQPAHFSQGAEREAIARANGLRNGGGIAVFSRSKPQIELRSRTMAGEANMPSCQLLSTRRHARNIHIRSPCWITNPAPGVSRGRGENTRVAWITTYSGTLPVMKRIASGSILSQCWRCDPHNSGKNSQDEERKPHGSLPFASPETPAPIIYFQLVNNEQFETQWCMRNLIRIKSDQARRIEVDVAGAIG
jgi:hypothetical protein